MYLETAVRSAAIVALVVAASACGPSAEDRRKADSAVAAALQEKAVTQAGDVMSARREAQPYLDRARTAFLAKNRARASSELRDAASFTRSQADIATEPAKRALTTAAGELGRLAARVASGSVKSVKTLDRSFANVHYAEAQLHCTRALDAWKQTNGGAAASEMVMLADHFERAASDAGKPLSASARDAIANARSIAGKLAKGVTLPAADVESALQAMDKEIHGMMAGLGGTKS